MKISEQTAEFRCAIGRACHTTPHIPADADVRLALLLVLEEAHELVESCVKSKAEAGRLKAMVLEFIQTASLEVSIVGVADALADIDYTVAGARHEFGIDGEPIADSVHAANMRKLDGPVDPVTGKKKKPAGWVGPEVEIMEHLRGQGWCG